VLFDSTDWYWRDDGVPLLADFWEAIFADWEVEVRHRDRNSDVVHEDRLQPYGLVWKAGQWYVVGLNIRVGRIQRIRVERVLQVTPTKTNFSYPEGFDLEGWWRDDLTRFGTGANRVVLEIGKGAIADFLRLGRKQTTKVDVTDDHLRMELFVDKWEWLIPLLMSYGAEVVVIEPTELRDAIMERHRLAVTALEQGQAISDIRSKPEDNRLRPTRGGRY
jgi:predicted DNA-binding transcriptional regulator YafY